MPLTPRQKACLNAIINWRHAHGYSPSQSDLADELMVSINTVQRYLFSLERKGYIKRDYATQRSIVVLREEQ